MSNSKCQICEANAGKYSCPRCNLFYCSVNCYQSERHLQCSEGFYEECVKEELGSRELDPEAKRKMLEILRGNQRSDSEESLDSDDLETDLDLASRMLDLDLDDENAVWEKLTPDEKREFRKLVATGDIIKIIPNWEPWWKTVKVKMLIQESNAEEFDWKKICPYVPSEIPVLSTLTKAEPSPNVAYILLNVLASYVFTVRWFKGTHLEMSVESVSMCLALSEALRNKKVFCSVIEALLSFQDDFSKCKWLKESEYNENLMIEDLKHIAREKFKNEEFFFIKASLGDLSLIVSKAVQVLQECNVLHLKRFTGTPPNVKQLHLISRKIVYYLSWTVSHGNLLVNAINNLGC